MSCLGFFAGINRPEVKLVEVCLSAICSSEWAGVKGGNYSQDVL